jgi:hypothetical protein
MEFHGIFHGISWNYEIEVDGIPWKIPWNSMEFHEKFHGIEFHGISSIDGI